MKDLIYLKHLRAQWVVRHRKAQRLVCKENLQMDPKHPWLLFSYEQMERYSRKAINFIDLMIRTSAIPFQPEDWKSLSIFNEIYKEQAHIVRTRDDNLFYDWFYN